jgi:PAS domain S-box-containing protein
MQPNPHDSAYTSITAPDQANQLPRPESILGLGFYTAFEHATIGMMLLDGHRNCLAANRALCNLLECEEPELLGQRYGTFLSSTEQAEAVECFNRLFNSEATQCTREQHYVTSSGKYLSGLMSASVIMSNDDKPLWVIVQFQDMSEYRHDIERQRILAETLQQACLELNDTLDEEQVLDDLLKYANRIVPCDALNIMLVDPSTDEAYVVRTKGYEGCSVGTWISQLRFPLASVKGMQKMMQTGQPLIILDVCQDPDWVTFAEMHWQRSYAAVPIRPKDQTIGFINFDSATPGFFNAAQIESAQSLANQAALALANARLYMSAHQRMERLTPLQQAGMALARVESVEALYREALRSACALAKASVAMLALFDGLSHLVIVDAEGIRPEIIGLRLGLGEAANGEAARLRHTVQVPHYEQWPGHSPLLADQGIDSIVALPLIWQDHLVGTLAVADNLKHNFDVDDVYILEQFAVLLAGAVEQWRTLSKLRAREVEANILNTWLTNTQEEERARIAGQLHDTISSRLLALQKSTGIILNTLWPDDPLAGQLSDAQKMLQETHHQANSLALELNAKMLDDLGINPAAQQYVAHLSATTGVQIQLHVVGYTRRLVTQIEHLTYHGLQELISSALHHPETTHITVQIHFGSKTLRLTVQDDGHEFSIPAGQTGSANVSGALMELQQQVEALNGQLSVENIPDRGTLAVMSLPCQDAPTPEKTRIRVLLVDDEEISRQGLRVMLAQNNEFTCVGEATDGFQAIQQVELLRPDLVVMDVKLPHLTGIDAARQISKRFPHVRIVMLSYYNDETSLQQALQAGVQGYLLKSDAGAEIIAGLRAVCEDTQYVSSKLAGAWERLQMAPATHDPLGALTTREREVFRLVVAGDTNRKVGETLGISVRTVEVYRKNIMSKLGMKNLAQLVQFAHDQLHN